jgi:large subunit ribosomal protein L35
MPKMKIHTGVRKRIKVTGTGKIMKSKAGLQHNMEKKPSKMTRRMTGMNEVAKVDSKRIKKMIGR